VLFRNVKVVLPLFLLYALPGLMTRERDYRELFSYLFAVALFILGAQVFTISTGQSPANYFAAVEEGIGFTMEVNEDATYRGFYNPGITLLAIFGSMFYMAFREKQFAFNYLVAVLLAVLLAIFLSATRGWILSFSLATVLFLFFVLKVSPKRLGLLLMVGMSFFLASLFLPTVRVQVNNSIDRLMTIQKLAGGDTSAGGTLKRLEERGPRVMRQWDKSRLTGWGFSDHYFAYRDYHVGNQNLLLHAGVVGMALLYLFLGYLTLGMALRNGQLSRYHPYKGAMLVFPIFLFGWFLLHSTSIQQFGYETTLVQGMVLSIFFSFAGLAFHESGLPADELRDRDT
jgi:hypothetical protein